MATFHKTKITARKKRLTASDVKKSRARQTLQKTRANGLRPQSSTSRQGRRSSPRARANVETRQFSRHKRERRGVRRLNPPAALDRSFSRARTLIAKDDARRREFASRFFARADRRSLFAWPTSSKAAIVAQRRVTRRNAVTTSARRRGAMSARALFHAACSDTHESRA